MSEQRPTHDALFRGTFGRPDNARGLLRHWLPSSLTDLVVWESVRLEDPSSLDDDLRPYYSDLLFSLTYRPARGDHSAATHPNDLLVYVLVEHQSTVDPRIAWRMQHYISLAQRRYLADSSERDIPIVVPVLVSNATKPWPHALDLHSAYPESLRALPQVQPHVAQLHVILDDLPATTIEELLQRQLTDMAVVALCMLRDARRISRLLGSIPQWIGHLRRVLHSQPGDYAILVQYLNSLTTPEQRGPLCDTILQEAPDMAQQFLSSLDDLWNRGEQKGRIEGRTAMLREQLEVKFGALPAWVDERLRSATDEQIRDFARRILTEKSLEATLATTERS